MRCVAAHWCGVSDWNTATRLPEGADAPWSLLLRTVSPDPVYPRNSDCCSTVLVSCEGALRLRGACAQRRWAACDWPLQGLPAFRPARPSARKCTCAPSRRLSEANALTSVAGAAAFRRSVLYKARAWSAGCGSALHAACPAPSREPMPCCAGLYPRLRRARTKGEESLRKDGCPARKCSR